MELRKRTTYARRSNLQPATQIRSRPAGWQVWATREIEPLVWASATTDARVRTLPHANLDAPRLSAVQRRRGRVFVPFEPHILAYLTTGQRLFDNVLFRHGPILARLSRNFRNEFKQKSPARCQAGGVGIITGYSALNFASNPSSLKTSPSANEAKILPVPVPIFEVFDKERFTEVLASWSPGILHIFPLLGIRFSRNSQWPPGFRFSFEN